MKVNDLNVKNKIPTRNIIFKTKEQFIEYEIIEIVVLKKILAWGIPNASHYRQSINYFLSKLNKYHKCLLNNNTECN